MNRRTWFVRIAILVLALVSVGMMSSSCAPTPPPPPVLKDGRIAIEVEMNGAFVAVHATRAGVEKLASLWCAAERTEKDDAQLCGNTWDSTKTALGKATIEDSVSSFGGSTACQDRLCFMRDESCAGYLLSEFARMPNARVLDGRSITNRSMDFSLGPDLLDLPQSELRGLTATPTTTTTKVRIQALAAPGKAAVLRGSLNRFRRSTRIAQLMRESADAAVPTCWNALITRDANKLPPTIDPADDGTASNWADLFSLTFSDAVKEFSETLPFAITAMKESTESQSRAGGSAMEDAANQWNADIDSETSIARLLAYGDLNPIATRTPPAGGGISGMNLKPLGNAVVQIQPLIDKQATQCKLPSPPADTIGPSGVPVCPPKLNNADGQRALDAARRMFVTPFSVANSIISFSDELYHCLDIHYFELGMTEGSESKAKIFAREGITDAGVAFAEQYLCAEGLAAGKNHTVQLRAAPMGFMFNCHEDHSVEPPKSFSMPEVASAHFLGALSPNSDMSLMSTTYAEGGAMRTLDQMKVTAMSLAKDLNSVPVNATIKKSVEGVGASLQSQVGGQRLEFLIGLSPMNDPAHVDKVHIKIHGVTSNNGFLDNERFGIVQGVDALECVTTKKIQGVDCDPSQYLTLLTNAVGPLDMQMVDLKGGTLDDEIHSIPRPGQPTAPISVDYALYIVRKSPTTDNAPFVAFGGVVPIPGPGTISQGFSRHLFSPAGGTYEQVLKGVVSPNSDDCSKVEDTCAGIPLSFFPPLESEIVGDPSSQPFERSWQHYLDLARQDANTADQLGKEVVTQGIEIDHEKFDAYKSLLDDCGPDATVDEGCGNVEMTAAVLGDRPVCSWTVGGKTCDCPVTTTPCPAAFKQCPLPVKELDETNLANAKMQCNTALAALANLTGTMLKGGIDVTPFTETLRLVKSDYIPLDRTAACTALSDLRNGTGPFLSGDSPGTELQKRENYIATYIRPNFDRPTVTQWAQQMHYYEDFADNYRLTFGDNEVFNTNRPSRPSLNTDAHAPCHPRPEDLATGSSTWTQTVDCFEAGKNCSNPGTGVGLDGCPTEFKNGGSNAGTLTLDTEQAALMRRWAWGFGSLRRSVASLGLMTGQLGSMMDLARREARVTDEDHKENAGAGTPFSGPLLTDIEPAWVLHGTPFGKADKRSQTRCVALGLVAGPNNDTYRFASGRPVNWNGFLANTFVKANGDDSLWLGDEQGSSKQMAKGWPCVVIGNSCLPELGDPQMMYCGVPLPKDWDAYSNTFVDLTKLSSLDGTAFQNASNCISDCKASSGYVGTSRPVPASLGSLSPWGAALDEMWEWPAPNFCSLPPPILGQRRGAIWRALCAAPGAPIVNANVMVYGVPTVPSLSEGIYSRTEIGDWFQMQNGGTGWDLLWQRGGQSHAFQYDLDTRNVYDALELACHAAHKPKTAGGNCLEKLGANYTPASLDEISSFMQCLGQTMRALAASMVAAPIPKALLEARRNGRPLAPGGGLGGNLLASAIQEDNALLAIQHDLFSLAEEIEAVGAQMKELDAIDEKVGANQRQIDYQISAIEARKAANIFNAIITVLAKTVAIAAAVVGTVVSGGSASGVLGALADTAVAAVQGGIAVNTDDKDIAALKEQKNVVEAEGKLERLGIVEKTISTAIASHQAFTDFRTHLNDFNLAANQLVQIQKRIEVDTGRLLFRDFLDKDKKNPNYEGVARRRQYNTTVLQYERALDRAKKSAFIARRAIELRFGVDLNRMSGKMTLVDAPAKWANDVCTMTGIQYSQVRAPNPDAAVDNFNFQAPPPGDDYASQFIGNYVQQLEDFTRSYPIDFPLKDGDDVAVISLSKDILGVDAACSKDSRNRLYYSTAFDRRLGNSVTASTKGWFVRGCGAGAPPLPLDAEWTGCVDLVSEGAPAGAPESGPQGTANGGVSLDGLPTGAVPYQLASTICVPNQTLTCPQGTTGAAYGSVAQILDGLGVGTYEASIFVHEAPNVPYSMNNGPSLRIVRMNDEAIVAENKFTVSSTWTRQAVVFQVGAGEQYRLEIVPSLVNQSLNQSLQIALWVSAAQVQLTTASDGGTIPPGGWERTESVRQVAGAACGDPDGVELRKRFKRHCEYVCKDGIRRTCAATDSDATPINCFYEAQFNLSLDDIEAGRLMPTGQIAIGNFNFRHNLAGINLVGTGVTDCSLDPSQSCFANGFVEYRLTHSGDVKIRNWEGGTLPAHMNGALIEHAKALATERVITNPPSSNDLALLDPYMKGELKGRPIEGSYALRFYETPSLRWERIKDMQLVWRYHYWTRFTK